MNERSFRRGLVIVAALAVFVAAPSGDAFAKKSDAQKCQKAIDKAAQTFAKQKLQSLFKCANKKFKKDEDETACLSEVSVSVSKGDLKKMEKSCPAGVLTGDPSENALGLTTCASRASCQAVTDAQSMANCIKCSYDFEIDCLFRAIYNASTEECLAP